MFRKHSKRTFGQSLVEFALILPALMLVIMGLFEFGRMFQVWLTLQYCAQSAARYASTGQQGVAPTVDPLDSIRLAAVKAEATKNATTLAIQPTAGVSDPGYFHVYVYASDSPTAGQEYPGGPNARVIVDVVFNHPLITPLGTWLARFVTLKAHSEMIVERFRFPGYGTPPGKLPPTIPPTPTPTNTPIPSVTPTVTPGPYP
jgi:Flp pilus assembly protein TadG